MTTQEKNYSSDFADWHRAAFGIAPEQAEPAAAARYQGWRAAQNKNPQAVELEICDKYGQRLHEGDIVLGHCAYIKNDGYLPKAAPKTVRSLLQITWNAYKAAYELKPVGVHPDDVPWVKRFWYRQPTYSLEVANARDARGFVAGKRADMVCETLERLPPAQALRLMTEMDAQLNGYRVASYAGALVS